MNLSVLKLAFIKLFLHSKCSFLLSKYFVKYVSKFIVLNSKHNNVILTNKTDNINTLKEPIKEPIKEPVKKPVKERAVKERAVKKLAKEKLVKEKAVKIL